MSLDESEGARNTTESVEDAREESPSFMWRMVLGGIRKGFPAAKQLNTEKLAQWINDPSIKDSILLLDVREKDEFAVSTIEGAMNVNPDCSDKNLIFEKIKERNDTPDKIEKVVCFCSIGYRSSKMAQVLEDKMGEEGYADKLQIFNLEGSIFKWANEGRGLVDAQGKKTVFCHPYSMVWGKFLESSLRKYTP